MKIGYLRVSTEEQKPDRQIDGLKDICDKVYIEKISAVSKKRLVYEKVKKRLKRGDRLIVWDLDRAFRSTLDALQEVNELREMGIEFQIMTMNLDTSTPHGKLCYTVMAAFAEFERTNLIERTKEGMAAAKRRGKHVGRPYKLTPGVISYAFYEIQTGNSTILGMAKKLNCTRHTLSRGFRRVGLET